MNHDEIVAKITKLTETTADIQKQLNAPKTLLDRFKEYAGVLSLLVGLILSVFALEEALVTKPSEALESDRNALHNTLNAIVLVDQDFIKARGEPMTSATVTAIGALSARRVMLLGQAEELTRKRNVATYSDESMLAGLYEWVSSYDGAMAHYAAANRLTSGDPDKEAYIEYKIATFDFMGVGNTTVADARAKFAHAVQLLDNAHSTQSRWELANIYQALSWCECNRGDRTLGEAAKAKAFAVADGIPSAPGAPSQSTFKATLEASLNATPCKSDPTPP